MLTKEQKEKYMHLAFEQAKKAEEQGEVPIGAVVVDKDGTETAVKQLSRRITS